MKKILLLCSLLATSVYSLAGPVLDSIVANKTITYGSRPNSIPYSKINEKGQFTGYSHDICDEIKRDIEAKYKINITVEKQEVSASTGILFVSNNTTSLMCGAASRTPERLRSANFLIIDADPVVPAVLATNQKINSLEDLKGKSISVIKGTTGETMLLKLNSEKGWGVKTILAKDYPEAFMLVEQGRAEAVVSNAVLLSGIITGVPANKFKLLTKIEVAPAELIGIVYTKTDNEMITQVKATEQRIKSDGTLERLHKKWFNQPLASGINLNVIWTDEQKKLIFSKL